MTKSAIWALVLIAIVVLVLIFNTPMFLGIGGKVNVHLLVKEISAMKSLVFLAFTAIGVAIGILLK